MIRAKIGMTQNKFAALLGVSQRTLENWEQGRRHPTGPATERSLKYQSSTTGIRLSMGIGKLIHMNGRIYDYNLGRFLSVDPFIQEPWY